MSSFQVVVFTLNGLILVVCRRLEHSQSIFMHQIETKIEELQELTTMSIKIEPLYIHMLQERYVN